MIEYSDRYSDDTHEYRYVILPPSYRATDKLYTEKEWRDIGLKMTTDGFI